MKCEIFLRISIVKSTGLKWIGRISVVNRKKPKNLHTHAIIFFIDWC